MKFYVLRIAKPQHFKIFGYTPFPVFLKEQGPLYPELALVALK
jgi:hypothetical protein